MYNIENTCVRIMLNKQYAYVVMKDGKVYDKLQIINFNHKSTILSGYKMECINPFTGIKHDLLIDDVAKVIAVNP